jgi:hypothetical protein
MDDQDLKELIQNLDRVGHAQKMGMTISVGINPNEFIRTNVSEFLSYRKSECDSRGIEMNFMTSTYSHISCLGEKDKSSHTLVLKGLSWKVREFYEEVLKWNWIDPNKTFIEIQEVIE